MADKTVEAVESIERAVKSKQARFDQDAEQSWGSILAWLKLAEIDCPPYTPKSRSRDNFLRNFWRQEPRLAGVMNAVNLIDSNRGWTLIGGRNQVRRYTDILHAAENGAGWRTFARKASLSFWATDLGNVTEIGRQGRRGPLRSIYHVDSARCQLTGQVDKPLQYFPPSTASQKWTAWDFFRICSMPSDDEGYHGLGYCAVSRTMELARLMYAVMMHDQEQVGAAMPRGLLLLKNISEKQWKQSLEAREEDMADKERRYFGAVQVLASSGADMDAKLLSLSQLPADFDRKAFLDTTMYGYALCFGYDPSEFWPVQYGALGRGAEGEMQHAKATGKGGLDWALSFQEQLQMELPTSLHFEFEQRDEAGEVLAASVKEAKLKPILQMYEAGLAQGASLISREQALEMAAAEGLIPEEWTVEEEEGVSTDTDAAEKPEERWLELDRVQRAIAACEEVVAYQWPSGKTRVVWSPHRVRLWRGVRRQEGVLYASEDGEVVITEEDVDKAIDQARRNVGAEMAELLTAPVVEGVPEGVEIEPPAGA